jgi:hypothetical protein
MIIVLVPHAGAPKVFAASAEEVVAMVSDTSETGSYVASLPPGVVAGEFEAAWIKLTIDLRHAKHFGTVADAWQYYALNSYGLPNVRYVSILTALNAMGTSTADGSKGVLK